MADIVDINEYYKIPKAVSTFQPFNSDAASKFMLTDLKKSGLDPVDVLARLFPMARDGALAAYYLPYFDVNGKALTDADGNISMFRLRQLPAPGSKTKRYYQPGSAEVGELCRVPYLHPKIWEMDGDTVLVCEGEKKTVCCIKYLDYPAIGIGGMASWRAAKGVADQIHPWILKGLKKLKAKNIVLVPDGDIRRFDIAQQYGTLATLLREQEYEVLIVGLPDVSDKIDDLIMKWGDNPRDEFHALPTHTTFIEAPASLIRRYELVTRQTNNGLIAVQNEANYMRLMEMHPAFSHLWFNIDTNRIMAGEKPLLPYIGEADVLKYIQKNLGFTTASRAQVSTSFYASVHRRKDSPFMDYLGGLTWDGLERLEMMFIDLAGAPDTPIVREIGSKWLVAAIRRLWQPGSMVDYMVIAAGNQGVGKSSFPGILWGKDNVVDILGHVNTKDLIMQMHSGLCVNLEEMAIMRTKEIDALKAMITNRTDVVRLPYARDVSYNARRFVLYGSVNHMDFLPQDSTGQRRYAVVPFTQVDFKALEDCRDQLWAEALYRFQSGDVKNVENIFLAAEDSKQYVAVNEDWERFMENINSKALGPIPSYQGYIYLTMKQVCAYAEVPNMRGWQAKSMREYLRSNGWEYHQSWARINGDQIRRVWVKPVNTV